jgi:hypothetical protein
MIMSSRSKRKKKLRSLTHKVEHLRLEVEYHDDALKEYEEEFMKELLNLTDGSLSGEPEPQPEPTIQVQGEGPDGPSGESIVESKQAKELPDDIKKIWKTIALMTHPDRTKNDPEKTELYLAANKAADEGHVDEILRIATELNIEIPEDSPLVEEKLESIANELETKLKQAEDSVLWQWGNAHPDMRKNIMDAYIAMKRLKKKT